MTIFEKIAAREIPAKIVFEDDDVMAFHDVSPQAPVHVLIVPKRVIPRLAETKESDQALLGKLILTATKVAARTRSERERLPCRDQQRPGRGRERAASPCPLVRQTRPGLAPGLTAPVSVG